MKKILCCILFFVLLSTPCLAKEPILDEETREVCNQVVLNIYYKILEVKDKYKELSQFNENAFYKNKRGLYTIIYKYEDETNHSRKQQPYSFGITVDTMEDRTFGAKKGSFDYGFPILGLKISGYQRKHLLRSQFNILPLVKDQGSLLANHQQKYLPLRLFLKPMKSKYLVKEDIEFEVLLKNVSKRHMTVKDLGEDTLFFMFENDFWGTSPSGHSRKKSRNVILKSGEAISVILKGESFTRTKDIEIFGVYRMSIDGVNPTAQLKITIVNDEPEENISN